MKDEEEEEEEEEAEALEEEGCNSCHMWCWAQ